MPEGDTLHRTATVLAQALVGQTLVAAEGRLPPSARTGLVGQRVTRVAAHGKNLLITFEDGTCLHTHLQMHGSWHLYRPGERWRRPRHDMRVVLDVGDIAAVCFGAPTVRLLASDRLDDDARLSELGPDVLAEALDVGDAVHRLRVPPDRPLGAALMDQTCISGIGNIYKSETLFLARRDPFSVVSALSDADLAAVVQRARALMRDNLRPDAGPRATRLATGDRYWVYRRSGLPCLVCGSAVRMRRQGEMHRSTYFCAACQDVRGV
jgi:endonuclease-8